MSDPILSKRLQWRIEALFYLGTRKILELLPSNYLFRMGECFGYILWPFMTKRRHFIARNLRIACDISANEADHFAKQSFVRTIANLFCSSLCTIQNPEKLAKILSIENPEMLHESSAKGNGVILLLAHMGNWELLTQICNTCAANQKSGAFYRPLNNPILNDSILKTRESTGVRMFSKRDGFHLVNHFLRENGILGILVDQRVGWQGRVSSFFGRLTRVSPVPSLLARRSHCEVLALSFQTIRPGMWSAKFHPVEKPYTPENCYKALETAMKVSLIDVFWLQERWKTYIDATRKPTDWLDQTKAVGTKNHRVVLWISKEEIQKPIPKSYLHDDIICEIIIDGSCHDLQEIDTSKNLPIDYVLSFSRNKNLEKTARQLCIPVHHIQERF